MIFFKFSLKQGKVLLGLIVHCFCHGNDELLCLLYGYFGIVNSE